MSQRHRPQYEFDTLPIEPIDPGTNLLVTGPALGGLRELVMGLLVCQETEGMLLLSTDSGGEEAIAEYEATGCPYETARMAVVDCTQDSQESDTRNIYTASNPGDLTGIGIVFSSLYEQLYGVGIERVRTGLYTLSTLLMYTDNIQTVYRFLHTMTGHIRQADGLGVSAIDPEAQDERTIRSLSQPFDGEVQLRKEDGTHELRVRGLADQPEAWQPFDLQR